MPGGGQLEDKLLDDVTVEDVRAVVGSSENGRLDFKELAYPGESGKQEFLRDVSAFANSDGGSIVIGAAERGTKDRCSELVNVADHETVIQRLRQCGLDGIADRLSIRFRPFEVEQGKTVVVVQVPASRGKPYMVIKDGLNELWRRYGTDKRKMSLIELRDAVLGDSVLHQLERIERKLDTLTQQQARDGDVEEERRLLQQTGDLGGLTVREVLWKAVDEEFVSSVRDRRYLRLTATPAELRPDRFDPSDEALRRLLEQPPGQRHTGWNAVPIPPIRATANGLESSDRDYHYVRLLRSGHLEFWTEIDEHFCWRQGEADFARHPRLYPYAVTEHPVSFLRLAKSVFSHAGYRGGIRWRMIYWNVKDTILLPYEPESVGFMIGRDRARPFDRKTFVREAELEGDFEPDSEALKRIVELYLEFGLDRSQVPFFDANGCFTVT